MSSGLKEMMHGKVRGLGKDPELARTTPPPCLALHRLARSEVTGNCLISLGLQFLIIKTGDDLRPSETFKQPSSYFELANGFFNKTR